MRGGKVGKRTSDRCPIRGDKHPLHCNHLMKQVAGLTSLQTLENETKTQLVAVETNVCEVNEMFSDFAVSCVYALVTFTPAEHNNK